MENSESILTEENKRRVVRNAMQFSLTPADYANRREDFPDPYLEVIENGVNKVVCFGANHQNDPAHPQMQQIKDLIDLHNPQVVLVEGMRIFKDMERLPIFIQEIKKMSYEEAAMNGEAFMTAWYSLKKDIKVDCPEPSYKDLFEALEKEGYDKRAIFLDKMFASASQWVAHGRTEPIEVYVEKNRKKWCDLLGLPSDGDVFEQCLGYAKELGIPLDSNNISDEDLIFSTKSGTLGRKAVVHNKLCCSS
ncbi:MAG: hypothetical protein R3B53_00335 [Candidatus Paceibacterota bacterium]